MKIRRHSSRPSRKKSPLSTGLFRKEPFRDIGSHAISASGAALPVRSRFGERTIFQTLFPSPDPRQRKTDYSVKRHVRYIIAVMHQNGSVLFTGRVSSSAFTDNSNRRSNVGGSDGTIDVSRRHNSREKTISIATRFIFDYTR